MVRPLIMALLAAATYLSAYHVYAAPVLPQTSDAATDLKPQIAWAEAWGRALYDAYKTKSKVSDLAMDSALFTASDAVTDKCPHASYRAVLVSPLGMPADRFAVYYIGSVPREQGLMIGRHYRVEVSGDGKTALSVAPSGKECLILPPPASGQPKAGTMVTHLLTLAPSEFHVFLSLLSGQPLFVGTKSGIWQVSNGKIVL